MKVKFTSNDQLVSMSDDQLSNYKNMLTHLINVRRRKSVPTISYENEMSWVQREVSIRINRKKSHQRFVNKRNNSQKIR